MSSRPDTFLPLFVADYLADTTHLKRDQDGAYLLLLMAYWRRGSALPADDARLARIAKATPAEWRVLRPIMLEFFVERDGHWHSKRSDEELAKANARIEAKANAGRKGAESRWQTDGNRMAVPLAEGMTKNGSPPSPSHLAKAKKPPVVPQGDTAPPKPKRALRKSPSVEAGINPDTTEGAAADYWNGMAEELGLAQVRHMTATRREKVLARISELGGLVNFAQVLDQIPKSPFLQGKNDRGWRVDFDWVLEPRNLVKISEGKFANGHA